ITPAGGTAPYTITPAQSNLGAGDYVFTITDANGCTVEVPVTITELPAPTAADPVDVTQCDPYTLPPLGAGEGGYFNSPGGVGPIAAGSVISTTQTLYVYAGTAGCEDENEFVVTITPSPTVTLFASEIPCDATTGTITVTASGGTAPFQYSIDGTTFQVSNIFNNLPAGNYTVTVRDANSCFNTANVSISQVVNTVAVSASAPSIPCGASNGIITATGSGGISPYEYSIDGTTFQVSNVFNNVPVGTYTITVRDGNGCLNTTTVNISQEANTVSISASAPSIPCGSTNGTITVTGSGGTAPLEYSIDATTFQTSNIFNNLPAGNYTVTARDANGCSITTAVTINQELNTVSVTATAPQIACGVTTGEITASGTGGTAPLEYSIDGTTFQVSNVFSNLAVGTYTVTARDANG
ncbi:hypothetical protein MD537_18120, partial [Flavihumibacter sediminis]|nr:hypothetical protein [Flavihumibacter sediminis]